MSIDIYLITFCFICGAILGSFLGLFAYRFPMGKYEPVRSDFAVVDTPLSVFRPARSFCPSCKQQLKWLHLIPLLSWLVLGGKCGFCRAPIGFRHFATESITATLCALCYLRFGLTPAAVIVFLILCAFVVITIIDIDYMIIPDAITYPGTLLGITLGLASSYLSVPGTLPLGDPFVSSITESLIGIASGAGSLLILWGLYLVIRRREGLGLGDIKLLALIGAFFGYECAIVTIFVGSILGSIVGVIMIVLRRHSLTSYLSFGPYLIAGTTLYLFQFADLINYLLMRQNSTVWRFFQQ